MKIAGTYLLQSPFGRNKTNLPTYLGGASQLETPYMYPGRSRNPAPPTVFTMLSIFAPALLSWRAVPAVPHRALPAAAPRAAVAAASTAEDLKARTTSSQLHSLSA